MIQQRLGESDSDYEARKKRVKRTYQGISANMFAHAGGGGGWNTPDRSGSGGTGVVKLSWG